MRPPRTLLFRVYFLAISVAMTVGHVPMLLFGSRQSLVLAMRRWAELTRLGLKHIAGIDVRIEGAEHIPSGGALIAAKHQSMWETIAFHLLLPDPALVMKSELLAVPLYGRYARRAQMIIVDRHGGARTMRRMIADARACLADHRQVVIFPEGTRKAPGEPPDYKPGVAALYAHLGVPCVPVAHNAGLFWPRRGPLQGPGSITLEFLPPIAPGLSREAFMAELEQVVEGATCRLLAGTTHTAPHPLVDNFAPPPVSPGEN